MLLLCSVISWLAASSATDERQPQHCWKHRVWGLRLDDEGRDDRCITAFVHTPSHHMNRIPASSTLRAAEQDKDSDIDMNIDSDGQDEQGTSSSSSSLKPKSKSEWIDGRTVMQLMELEKAREEQERQRQLEMELFNNRFQSPPAPSFQGNSRERVKDISIFRSQISYTDANSLQIELPPSGVNADVFFSGAFSALWFSAVGPATVGMLSSGGAAALFIRPLE